MKRPDSGPVATTPAQDVDPSARLRPLRRGLLPFGRRHRGQLGRGLLFTAILVATRLALPLPLTAVVARSETQAPQPALFLGGFDPVAVLAAGFVSLALMGGVAEHFQRLAFAHFAGRSVSDARAAALARLGDGDSDSHAPNRATSEVLADCARVKQGLKGVLNHIALNALLVLGACIAMTLVDVQLALVQLAGVGLIVAVAILGATRVAAVGATHRHGESNMATVIQNLVAPERVGHKLAELEHLRSHDTASGEADVEMTCWEGRTTCVVHIVLALTAAVVLILGVGATQAGRIPTASLFAVMAYLLLLHGPGVRFARQITRIGPLVVSANHLAVLLVDDPPQAGAGVDPDTGGHADMGHSHGPSGRTDAFSPSDPLGSPDPRQTIARTTTGPPCVAAGLTVLAAAALAISLVGPTWLALIGTFDVDFPRLRTLTSLDSAPAIQHAYFSYLAWALSIIVVVALLAAVLLPIPAVAKAAQVVAFVLSVAGLVLTLICVKQLSEQDPGFSFVEHAGWLRPGGYLHVVGWVLSIAGVLALRGRHAKASANVVERTASRRPATPSSTEKPALAHEGHPSPDRDRAGVRDG